MFMFFVRTAVQICVSANYNVNGTDKPGARPNTTQLQVLQTCPRRAAHSGPRSERTRPPLAAPQPPRPPCPALPRLTPHATRGADPGLTAQRRHRRTRAPVHPRLASSLRSVSCAAGETCPAQHSAQKTPGEIAQRILGNECAVRGGAGQRGERRRRAGVSAMAHRDWRAGGLCTRRRAGRRAGWK